MKIVFMGTPTFGATILKGLYDNGYDISLVISQPDRLGKKRELVKTPVHEVADALNLKIFQPEFIKNDYQQIIDCKPDVLITAAYGQYIPTKILKLFKKCINVHGSILPKYRGGAPIQRSIINGDKKTGITIMEMEKGLDTGKMYCKVEVPILDDDNSTSLFEKLSIVGRDALLNTIDDIYNDKIDAELQDSSLASYAPNLTKEEEKISFNETSLNIFNKIRGLAMEPGAYFTACNEIIKVYKSKVVDEKTYIDLLNQYMKDFNKDIVSPGEIISLKKKIVIKTLDSAIEILELKPSGKKLMKAIDFLNGQRILMVGYIV